MTLPSPLPRIIQGGMGVAVSDRRLANAVARTGQLGVVSGSMLDTVFVRAFRSERCSPTAQSPVSRRISSRACSRRSWMAP